MDEEARRDDISLRIQERAAELVASRMVGIVPERVYTPEEAASLLGIRSERRAKTIRAIPQALLPVVRVTPGGRTVGYYGRDLIRYIEQQREGGEELRRAG